MSEIPAPAARALRALLAELIDQRSARVIVRPHRAADGFWFGGGNLIEDAQGTLWLSGRYRDHGDSRTGLDAGLRGLECAVFASRDKGGTFEKVTSWTKGELSGSGTVLSIEGTDLHRRRDGGVELFVSLEKDVRYPAAVGAYQKPGTGVWSIDRLHAGEVAELHPASQEPVIVNADRPESLHVKDPVTLADEGGTTRLVFCSHPVSWASSNSGLALRAPGADAFRVSTWEIVPRGAIWDVAVTRITDQLRVPALGLFTSEPATSIYFYDGAECMRSLEENPKAASRPRGYSCEELGGALMGRDAQFPVMERISRVRPLFVSPHGTGSSRYVSTLVTDDGIYATWQQSQPDRSQPLVMRFLPMERVAELLAGDVVA